MSVSCSLSTVNARLEREGYFVCGYHQDYALLGFGSKKCGLLMLDSINISRPLDSQTMT